MSETVVSDQVSDQTGQPEQTTEAPRCCAGPVETGRWSRVECRAEYDRAGALARGWYQAGLLDGHQRLSGAGVSRFGGCGRWAGRNTQSRLAYLDRLTAAGVRWRVEIQAPHGAKVLVIECSGRCRQGLAGPGGVS